MTMHIRTVWHPNILERTYAEHRDVLTVKKKVYWGVIHDGDYPEDYRHIIDQYLPALNSQIGAGQSTYLFIETRDPQEEYFWGKISCEILVATRFTDWDTSKLVPAYYKTVVNQRPDLIIDYWIPLSDFRKIPHEIFKKARPVEYNKYDAREYGKYGRPFPMICDFEYENGLQAFLKQSPKNVPENEDKDFVHSEDYHSIKWRGEAYTLTNRQAQVVELLHKHHKQGTPEISQAFILEKLDNPSSRLRDSFKNSPLWGKLIVQGKKKGTYRLDIK